jgi:hypothetical protein
VAESKTAKPPMAKFCNAMHEICGSCRASSSVVGSIGEGGRAAYNSHELK